MTAGEEKNRENRRLRPAVEHLAATNGGVEMGATSAALPVVRSVSTAPRLRGRYRASLRAEVVDRVLAMEVSCAEAARQTGVPDSTIRSWVKAHDKWVGRPQTEGRSRDEEKQALRSRVAELETTCDTLLRALGMAVRAINAVDVRC